MFFYLSKIIWFILQPSSLLIFLFLLGFLLYWRGFKRSGFRLLLVTVMIYTVAGLSPLANAMLFSLERHYAPGRLEELREVHGIIVLGGVIDTLVAANSEEIALNEAAERLTEAAALAHRFPQARIVFSGGDGALVYKSMSEADLAQRFFERLGIDPARVSLERDSRNTYENAQFTREMIKPKAGERWLLITSAFHMPRAMGCFRAAEFEITPWPVDFRTRGVEDLLRFSPRPSTAWRRIDLAAKEWIGTLAYRLTGRMK